MQLPLTTVGGLTGLLSLYDDVEPPGVSLALVWHVFSGLFPLTVSAMPVLLLL